MSDSQTPEEIADEEYWAEMYADAMEGVAEYEAEIEHSNQRLLNAIKKVKGELFYEWLLLLLEDFTLGECKFEIVKKPHGNRQVTGMERTSFGKIKEWWVSQWSVGDGGDTFAGIIYIQLAENKYIEMPY